MKLTKNMIRNVCVLFLTLRDKAEAEGLTQAVANADKAYRNYQELLYQADGKRPSGVGAGQPLSWKITFKSRLALIGGECNGEAAINSNIVGGTCQAAGAAAGSVSSAGELH